MHIRPIKHAERGPRWAVYPEDDVTPLATHDTLEEAEIDAREFAREFGPPDLHPVEIITHHLDRSQTRQLVEPEHRAPTVRDVKGPAVG
jgi:hypothetical protein